MTIPLACVLLLVPLHGSAELDDPTRPPNTALVATDQQQAAGSWDLTSILVSPQRRVAIINGKTVRVGDTLGGARVIAIAETTVTISQRGETIILKLLPARVKTARDRKTTGK